MRYKSIILALQGANGHFKSDRVIIDQQMVYVA